jgi:autotransporter-associated beta strand protein
LSANQTWNAGSYLQTFDAITGPGSLTTNGYVYLDNYSDTGTTFSGGLTVASGYFSLEDANAAGTGPITIESGSEFYAYNANLPNAVTLGASVTLGSDSEYGFNLTLSGPVTLQSAATSVSIDAYSSITIAGAVSGPASTALSLSSNAYPGTGSLLTYDGGSQVVFQGTLSNVTAVNVSNLSLILAPSGPPASAFNPSASGLLVTNQSYLGLDGTFSSTPMAVSTFLSTYGPTLGPTISGTLGFDTIANPSSPNTFSDAINLSAFTSSSFQGLGSETAAIITGTITPPGNAYPFGGGGGTLTVQSALVDGGSPRSVAMNSTSEPLTVILQSTGNTYTGGTTSNGGVLIFDSPTPTVAGSIQLTGSYSGNVGYVGYTSKATNITAAANFVSLISTSASTGVIGFDTLGGDSPLGPITDPINLTAFGEIGPFLGTSTSATLEGTITPANNQYQFTGVKGGSLTVSSPLTDTAASAVIGLAYPIEAAGTISTVTLSGTNTYTGGTTLNSGAVFISNGSALGTGTISIPSTDHNSPTVPPPSLAPYGSTVTLGNAISVGAGVNGNPAVEFGNYSTTDMLVLNGVISDYPSQSGHVGIQGPVTLNQANTYTGGTTLNGSYSTNVPVYIGNNAAFGTGQITVNEPATLIPDAGGPVALANSIELGDTLTLGQATNPYLLTLNGIINGYYGLAINGPVALNGANTFTGSVVINNAAVSIGNPGALGTGTVALNGSTVTDNFSNPSYLDLTGDSTSMIVLVPSATLTLNTDYYAVPATFQGNIMGNSTNQVVIAGTGTQELAGNSIYSGGTMVNDGAGLIAGSSAALGTGTVDVAAGATLLTTTGVVLTNTLTLNPGSPGSVLGGSGTYSPSGGVAISGGVTLSPGTGGGSLGTYYVGSLSFGTGLTLGTGGIYTFAVENAGGVAGTDYDTVNVSGTLTVTATPGSPFQINLTSFNSSGTLGLATFDPTLAYSWTLISAGSISGFAATDFAINTANFQNSLGGGAFNVLLVGNDLDLNFTPVPEPSTWLLMAAGLATLGACAYRTRRHRA